MDLPTDIRCYNGCFDSATLYALSIQDKALARIRIVEPQAHITYFPMEGMYQVHVWGRPLSGMCNTRAQALRSTLSSLGLAED